jgi:hypothetical protein
LEDFCVTSLDVAWTKMTAPSLVALRLIGRRADFNSALGAAFWAALIFTIVQFGN